MLAVFLNSEPTCQESPVGVMVTSLQRAVKTKQPSEMLASVKITLDILMFIQHKPVMLLALNGPNTESDVAKCCFKNMWDTY